MRKWDTYSRLLLYSVSEEQLNSMKKNYKVVFLYKIILLEGNNTKEKKKPIFYKSVYFKPYIALTI